MIRLNKFLAQCGLGSRRKCDHLIQSGEIRINGEKVTQLGFLVDEEKDLVLHNNIPISIKGPKTYILLNKPTGYVTTVKDERGRKTVLDLVPSKKRLFPVGRLDMNTEGLLLLTNDGRLCYQLTHPKFYVDKVYQVTINSNLKLSDKTKLEHGIMLDTGPTAPCKIKFIAPGKNRRILHVILHEGKKRQVRKMFQTLGYHVVHLVRLQFGNLKLNNLPLGKWRYLAEDEIGSLYSLIAKPHNLESYSK